MSTQTDSVGPFSKSGSTSARTLQSQSSAACREPRRPACRDTRFQLGTSRYSALQPATSAVGRYPLLLVGVLTLSNAHIQPAFAWDTCSSVATTPQGVCDHVCDGGTAPCIVTNCQILHPPAGDPQLHCSCYSVPESALITGFTCYNYSSCPSGTAINTSTGVCSQFYTSITLPKKSEPTACCANPVAHPINPVTGAVFDTIVDIPATGDSPGFKRFYNSTNTGVTDLPTGWRHSYSRTIQANYQSVALQPYAASAMNSSLYDDPAMACTNGFAEIRTRVSTWVNAVATYGNGVCTVTLGGANIGTVRLSSSVSPVAPNSLPVTFDVTRDDGQIITFTVQGGSIVAPPTIGLKLQLTNSGYTLTDENDNVENYDGTGILLSITTRTGVVQTMSYDSSGRLSNVTDNFGRSMSLSYDDQGRLSKVTRP